MTISKLSADAQKRPAHTSLELDISDPATLRQRAILDLLRAISIGRMIAFVGSGATGIYGYPTWDALCIDFAEKVLNHTRAAALSSPHLKLLHNAIHNAIESAKAEKFASSDLLDLAQSVLEGMQKLPHDCPGRKNISSLRAQLAEGFVAPARHTVKSFRNRLTRYCKPGQDTDIIKNELRALWPDALIPADLQAVAHLVMSNSPSMQPPGKNTRLATRRPYIDPLARLQQSLQITRFATLNYDLEIERLLEDGDFPYDSIAAQLEGHAPPRRDARSRMGARAVSITMRPSAADELLKFALQTSPDSTHVIHLHGSCNMPESMVVTQDAYNDLYVAENATRAAFEDAQQLIVSANAVLFVGTGMTEEDILRPMRLMSGKLRNRPLFALMPSKYSEEHDLAFVQKIKAKYGVNVVVYGTSLDDALEEQFQSWEDHPLRQRLDRLPARHDVSPLYKELGAIRECCVALATRATSASKVIGNLHVLIDPKVCPRLATSQFYGPLLRALDFKLLFREDRIRLIRFVKSLESIAIAQALNDALEFLGRAAPRWRERWNLEPVTDKPKRKAGASFFRHIPSYIVPAGIDKQWVRQCEVSLNTHIHAKRKSVFRLAAGLGKGCWLAVAAKLALENPGKAAVLSFEYMLDAGEFMEALDAFLEEGGKTWVYLHNGDKLLNSDHTHFCTTQVAKSMRRLSEKDISVLISCQSEEAETFLKQLFANEFHTVVLPPVETELHDLGLGIWPQVTLRNAQERLSKLKLDSDGFRKHLLSILRNRLRSVAPERRIGEYLEILITEHGNCIEAYGTLRQRQCKVLMHCLLKWISAFALPVSRNVFLHIREVKEIFESYECRSDAEKTGLLRDALDELCLLRWATRLEEANRERYVVHREMRRFLVYYRGLSFLGPDVGERASISLFPVLMDHQPLLSEIDFKDATDLFREIVDSKDRDKVRAAYGLLRGSLFLGSVLRAGHAYARTDFFNSVLDQHAIRLLRLRAAARDSNNSSKSQVKGAFYDSERLWLLNELGVTRLLQGEYHDAVMILREADHYARNSAVRISESANAKSSEAWVCKRMRVRLNLVSALTERGGLDEALSLATSVVHDCDRTELDCLHDHPEVRLLRSVAYALQALVHLLIADNGRACQQFRLARAAADGLKQNGFLAWMDYSEHRILNTPGMLARAISLAGNAQRPDLQLSFEIAQIESVLRQPEDADLRQLARYLRDFDRMKSAAHQLGLIRVVVAINLVRARMQLALGQSGAARECALSAISSAMHHGMRIKRVMGIILLAAVMIDRGEVDAARKLLTDIRFTADRLRYVSATIQISQLESISTPAEIQRWAESGVDSTLARS
jgi:SIR2-like domain